MKPEYSTAANPIGARLKQEMKKRDMASAELARRADVLTSFLYDIISGKSSNPSTVKLARVAEALGVSLNYLVSGADTANDNDRAQKNGYIVVPRITVNYTSGGNSVIANEELESYSFRSDWVQSHLHAHPHDLRMITVNGDSMEPTLCHNDVVLVDTGKQLPSPPGIFVIFDGLGLMAKRLEFVPGSTKNIRIISDRAQYSTYERSIDEVTIVGRVVWFSREM